MIVSANRTVAGGGDSTGHVANNTTLLLDDLALLQETDRRVRLYIIRELGDEWTLVSEGRLELLVTEVSKNVDSMISLVVYKDEETSTNDNVILSSIPMVTTSTTTSSSSHHASPILDHPPPSFVFDYTPPTTSIKDTNLLDGRYCISFSNVTYCNSIISLLKTHKILISDIALTPKSTNNWLEDDDDDVTSINKSAASAAFVLPSAVSSDTLEQILVTLHNCNNTSSLGDDDTDTLSPKARAKAIKDLVSSIKTSSFFSDLWSLYDTFNDMEDSDTCELMYLIVIALLELNDRTLFIDHLVMDSSGFSSVISILSNWNSSRRIGTKNETSSSDLSIPAIVPPDISNDVLKVNRVYTILSLYSQRRQEGKEEQSTVSFIEAILKNTAHNVLTYLSTSAGFQLEVAKTFISKDFVDVITSFIKWRSRFFMPPPLIMKQASAAANNSSSNTTTCPLPVYSEFLIGVFHHLEQDSVANALSDDNNSTTNCLEILRLVSSVSLEEATACLSPLIDAKTCLFTALVKVFPAHYAAVLEILKNLLVRRNASDQLINSFYQENNVVSSILSPLYCITSDSSSSSSNELLDHVIGFITFCVSTGNHSYRIRNIITRQSIFGKCNMILLKNCNYQTTLVILDLIKECILSSPDYQLYSRNVVSSNVVSTLLRQYVFSSSTRTHSLIISSIMSMLVAIADKNIRVLMHDISLAYHNNMEKQLVKTVLKEYQIKVFERIVAMDNNDSSDRRQRPHDDDDDHGGSSTPLAETLEEEDSDASILHNTLDDDDSHHLPPLNTIDTENTFITPSIIFGNKNKSNNGSSIKINLKREREDSDCTTDREVRQKILEACNALDNDGEDTEGFFKNSTSSSTSSLITTASDEELSGKVVAQLKTS